MFVNKNKATAVTTAPLLYLLFEIFESHDEYAEAAKAADAVIARTTRNNGKKRAAVPTKDPPFVHRLRTWIQAATESFLAAEDRLPSDLAAKIHKYRFPTQHEHLTYHVDSVTEVALFCPFCAADGHQSTMVVYEATLHQTKTAQAKAEFADHMATYNNLTQQQQRSTKPPPCKLPKMKAACICVVQHNLGNIEGGNCRDCCSAYELNPMALLAPRSYCAVCKCTCNALFPIDEIAVIERAIKDGIDGKGKPSAVKQPPISMYQVLRLHTATNILFLQTIWQTLYRCSGTVSIAASLDSSSNRGSFASISMRPNRIPSSCI
jgi:hypothetical protein